MRVAFRADASEDIGTGHVMRCLALAQALRARGAECVFVCRELPGHLAERIVAQDFAVQLLPLQDAYAPPAAETDYRGWAQVADAPDAAEFVSVAGTCDVVVIDHYGFGQQWESAIRAAMPASLLAIDDLCRPHCVDYLLDQNFGRSAADYSASTALQPRVEVLAGPAYALLRAEFAEVRATLQRPAVTPPTHHLLVTLGGVDKHNVTGDAVAALQSADLPWLTAVTVLLPEAAPHYRRVQLLLEGHPRYRLLGSAKRMAELMAAATLCVGAVGGTAWERAAVGLPSVLVPVAANQQGAAERLAAADVALLLAAGDISEKLVERLQAARRHWPALVNASLQICDARGAERVAERLLNGAASD